MTVLNIGVISVIVDTRVAKIDDMNTDIAQKMMSYATLSDSSKNSEVYSSCVITSIFGSMGLPCDLYKTETTIEYIWDKQKTDYILNVGLYRVAVEVKRVYPYPSVIISPAYVNRILDKANSGAIESNENVSDADRWNTQILHIITTADILTAVSDWSRNTTECGFSAIFITIVDGDYDFIF